MELKCTPPRGNVEPTICVSFYSHSYARIQVLPERLRPRPGTNFIGVSLGRSPHNRQCQFLREGDRHTVYVNRKFRKSSAVPRHRELNDFLCRKICDDLQIPRPNNRVGRVQPGPSLSYYRFFLPSSFKLKEEPLSSGITCIDFKNSIIPAFSAAGKAAKAFRDCRASPP